VTRLVLIALIVAPAAALPARGAELACVTPRCADVSVPYDAQLKVPENRVRVLFPRGYDPGCARRYPVLYLLHGAGDTYRTWTERTDVEALSSALELIVAMPDGGRNADAGWYSDWRDGSRHWESFHIGVMIPWVDANLCTVPARGSRAVAGLSMGGFGAMHYAARHPDVFALAASFSGAVDTMYGAPASGAVFTAIHPYFGTPDDRVWGNQVADEASWRANNPTDLAARLAGTRLLIATGNGAPGGAHEDPANPGGYPLENGIWQMNLSFTRALDAAGVPYTDLFYGPGHHDWPYWRDDLAWSLPQVLSAIS
jgi:S-formylglutathione hydrolase FrmB